jgi:hypothetical protein
MTPAGRALGLGHLRRAPEAARRLRSATATHLRRSPSVPKLRATTQPSATPTVWVIAPDWNEPSGGVRKLYRSVDVLNANGLPAAIVHQRPGFSCTWFAHDTRISPARDVVVSPSDVIAVPEIYAGSICELPPGIRRVIVNQNVYLLLESLVSGGAPAAAPYLQDDDLAAVLVVSQQNLEVMKYVFPQVRVDRVRWAVDPDVYHRSPDRPGKRIAYMTRKRTSEASEVLRLLSLTGATDGWELVPIAHQSEGEVAAILRTCRIFLSFGQREGLGLPPLEAMASGCLVVGFDGFAGREFFGSPYARSVENGDVVAFARAVEELIRQFESDPTELAELSDAAERFVAEHYSANGERDDLVGLFGPLLAR